MRLWMPNVRFITIAFALFFLIVNGGCVSKAECFKKIHRGSRLKRAEGQTKRRKYCSKGYTGMQEWTKNIPK